MFWCCTRYAITAIVAITEFTTTRDMNCAVQNMIAMTIQPIKYEAKNSRLILPRALKSSMRSDDLDDPGDGRTVAPLRKMAIVRSSRML